MSIRDRYVLDGRLGTGGMAEVYRARRLGVNDFARSVAIKRLLGGAASSQQLREMFIAEARITSQLVHPNIVSVLDFDRDDDGSLCLVMELVEGSDLARLMRTGHLPFDVVGYIIVEALKGVGHAHRFAIDGHTGVVHRDLSPHNVLLSWHGEVKVSDFGLAKVKTGSSATATHLLKGKPAYMSPEQANSQRLDGRSDLFALGTIMWELLVGRPLFGADDTRASIAAILFGTVPHPRQLRPEVPRELERIALKLLQRDRNDRYRSAEHAIDDLLRSSPVDDGAHLAAVLAERFARSAPEYPSAPRPHRAPLRRRWSSLWLVALGAVSAVVVAGARADRERPPVRTTDSYVSLAEKQPLSSLQPPTFLYRLDPKELPPSCLLLLDWMKRNVQAIETTSASAIAQLVEMHDHLARDVAIGHSIAKLDSDCRLAATSLATSSHHTPPPLPFLGVNGPAVIEAPPSYYDAFEKRITSSTDPRRPQASTPAP